MALSDRAEGRKFCIYWKNRGHDNLTLPMGGSGAVGLDSYGFQVISVDPLSHVEKSLNNYSPATRVGQEVIQLKSNFGTDKEAFMKVPPGEVRVIRIPLSALGKDTALEKSAITLLRNGYKFLVDYNMILNPNQRFSKEVVAMFPDLWFGARVRSGVVGQ